MALMNCEECDKPVSDKAAARPHCGAPLQTSFHEPDEQLTPNQAALSTAQIAVQLKAQKRALSPQMPIWGRFAMAAFLTAAVYSCVTGKGSNTSITPREFDEMDALVMCQMAINACLVTQTRQRCHTCRTTALAMRPTSLGALQRNSHTFGTAWA